MISKTKRVLPATLMVVSVLSFSVVVPAMAENTTVNDGEYLTSGVCDVLIGVDPGRSSYSQNATFTLSGWIENHEWEYVDYDMTLTLNGPSGDSWDFDGCLYYYKRIEHEAYKDPPPGDGYLEHTRFVMMYGLRVQAAPITIIGAAPLRLFLHQSRIL